MSYATPAAVVILGLVSVLAPLMDSRQRQLDTGAIEGRITFAGPPPPPTIVIQDITNSESPIQLRLMAVTYMLLPHI